MRQTRVSAVGLRSDWGGAVNSNLKFTAASAGWAVSEAGEVSLLTHDLEDQELQVIARVETPEYRVVRCLRAELDLTEALVG